MMIQMGMRTQNQDQVMIPNALRRIRMNWMTSSRFHQSGYLSSILILLLTDFHRLLDP